MDNETLVGFDACVVCEYTRHWDTHRFNQVVGGLMDSALAEIIGSNRGFIFDYDGGESKFEVSHFDKNSIPEWFKQILNDESKKRATLLFNKGYLAFASTVTISADQYQNALRNADGSPIEKGVFTDEELVRVYKEVVVGELSDYAFLFSLAANIAKPGAFQLSGRYLIQDRSLIEKTGGTLNNFQEAMNVSSKYSWPPIMELRVLDVWDWLVTVPGFLQGEAKTNLGRALGAVSYLLSDDYKRANDLALVWALIGLESLYGKGNVGLKMQLLEKTEAFLGERTSFKKMFGNMYDFRSRLVHGDKNFHYKGYDGILEEEYSEKLYESENIAIATLISTLQKMCVQKKQELDFRTIVEQ